VLTRFRENRFLRDFPNKGNHRNVKRRMHDTIPTDPDTADHAVADEQLPAFQIRYCVMFLTDRRNYGAHEVKATRKIPAASLIDDADGRSVAVGV